MSIRAQRLQKKKHEICPLRLFQRYRRWNKAGRFTRIFEAISGEADMEYAMIDDSIVKVHRHGQRGKGDPESGYR